KGKPKPGNKGKPNAGKDGSSEDGVDKDGDGQDGEDGEDGSNSMAGTIAVVCILTAVAVGVAGAGVYFYKPGPNGGSTPKRTFGDSHPRDLDDEVKENVL
ncbi:hypothetical protein ElyMa_003004300, partial [Elysia marginata]